MTTYGIVGFDNAEELDMIGPWEVFGASGMVHARDTDRPADQVVLIAQTLDPIRCNKGLRLLPDATYQEHPPLDVVLIPGGLGTRKEMSNPLLLDWLRGVAPTAAWVTSVCTGSVILHASGLADGKRLATHWTYEDTLESLGATVVRDSRWVRDGKVVSSQGVSAGIDMALWLIGQIDSPAHAKTVQRYIQYDPAPPYQADI
jgi:transcriptional regulator GlxA family with amidase domain